MIKLTMIFERVRKAATDFALSHLREVTLHHEKGFTSTHLVPVDDVERFVQAQIQMHNGTEGEKFGLQHRVGIIAVSKLELAGPMYWTTPGLPDNDPFSPPDPNQYRGGAHFVRACGRVEVFRDDRYQPKELDSDGFNNS